MPKMPVVTTVCVSGAPNFDVCPKVGQYERIPILFTPPEAIAGKLCSLQLKSAVAITDAQSASVEDFGVMVTCDLPQPNSFASIYSENPEYRSLQPDPRFGKVPSGSKNMVIGLMYCVVGGGNQYTVMDIVGDTPRCMVQIPDGPTEVTFGLLKAAPYYRTVGEPTDFSVENMTFLLEIIPYEDD